MKFSFMKTVCLFCAIIFAITASAQDNEQLINGDFSNDFTYWWSALSGGLVDGEFCVEVGSDPSNNAWDEMFGQDRVQLIQGETYTYSFDAYASEEGVSFYSILQNVSTYAAHGRLDVKVGMEKQTYTKEFVMTNPTDKTTQLTMQMGGSNIEATVCIDNLTVVGGPPKEFYTADTGSPVRTNQHGYLVGSLKGATYVDESDALDAQPLAWSLLDADGAVVVSGMTTPTGLDPASGDNAHKIDFSAFDTAGIDYTIVVGDDSSHPFEIGEGLYDQMAIDSLHYFYHNRSNIDIEAQYVGEEYARDAGHTSETKVGDDSVTCGGWTTDLTAAHICPYSLDVRGGWYDAGDHGKYVVNGGISVWKILNSYERSQFVEGAFSAIHGDGAVLIPENGNVEMNGTLVSLPGNGVPDSLDEARWEMEFLMSMQVPADQPLGGMVHHKVQNIVWAKLPQLPATDPLERILRPAGTAATLNLSATAAQCARIWETIDPAFSAECLASAESSWLAAVANPEVYIYANDNNGNGGGPYDDQDVSDEFYWAAAELYLTTGKAEYLDFLQASPHHDGNALAEEFFWQATAPLGSISLATVPSDLPQADMDVISSAITDAADLFVERTDGQAYPTSYKTDIYHWGSNNTVMNNAITMGVAYDLSGEQLYADGVLHSMDYLLGQNALNISYISRYGDNAFENPHHRHWANQSNATLPNAPAGSVSGGPNSELQDPIAQIDLDDCVDTPQKCYIDDIESYSTNEVTVNWNSALVWTSSFVSSQGDITETPTAVSVSELSTSTSVALMPVISGILLGTTFVVVRRKDA